LLTLRDTRWGTPKDTEGKELARYLKHLGEPTELPPPEPRMEDHGPLTLAATR
jgi:hypothetical protein